MSETTDPAPAHLMALVEPDGNGALVVRATHRLADLSKATWIAVTVETPVQSVEAGAGFSEAIALAQSLGARSERIVDSDLPDAILRYAGKNDFTQIVIGRARASWLRDVLHRSLPQELVRRAQGIAVHVITATDDRPRPRPLRWPTWSSDLRTVVTAVVGIALVVAAGLSIPSLAEQAIIPMLLLLAVLLSAAQGGFAASIFAALLAFLAYNFFFTAPHYTFAVKDWRDVLALFVFLVVAVTAGTLAGRTRDQALAAHSVFVHNAGKVVTQRQLLEAVWGPAHVEDASYLRVYVGQLRRKIEADDEAALIENEPGVGYRLRDE